MSTQFLSISLSNINVASSCTFCFFPEGVYGGREGEAHSPRFAFSGLSDTVFYFLTALCKMLVGNSLLNLQLGLCAAEVVISSAS